MNRGYVLSRGSKHPFILLYVKVDVGDVAISFPRRGGSGMNPVLTYARLEIGSAPKPLRGGNLEVGITS